MIYKHWPSATIFVIFIDVLLLLLFFIPSLLSATDSNEITETFLHNLKLVHVSHTPWIYEPVVKSEKAAGTATTIKTEKSTESALSLDPLQIRAIIKDVTDHGLPDPMDELARQRCLDEADSFEEQYRPSILWFETQIYPALLWLGEAIALEDQILTSGDLSKAGAIVPSFLSEKFLEKMMSLLTDIPKKRQADAEKLRILIFHVFHTLKFLNEGSKDPSAASTNFSEYLQKTTDNIPKEFLAHYLKHSLKVGLLILKQTSFATENRAQLTQELAGIVEKLRVLEPEAVEIKPVREVAPHSTEIDTASPIKSAESKPVWLSTTPVEIRTQLEKHGFKPRSAEAAPIETIYQRKPSQEEQKEIQKLLNKTKPTLEEFVGLLKDKKDLAQAVSKTTSASDVKRMFDVAKLAKKLNELDVESIVKSETVERLKNKLEERAQKRKASGEKETEADRDSFLAKMAQKAVESFASDPDSISKDKINVLLKIAEALEKIIPDDAILSLAETFKDWFKGFSLPSFPGFGGGSTSSGSAKKIDPKVLASFENVTGKTLEELRRKRLDFIESQKWKLTYYQTDLTIFEENYDFTEYRGNHPLAPQLLNTQMSVDIQKVSWTDFYILTESKGFAYLDLIHMGQGLIKKDHLFDQKISEWLRPKGKFDPIETTLTRLTSILLDMRNISPHIAYFKTYSIYGTFNPKKGPYYKYGPEDQKFVEQYYAIGLQIFSNILDTIERRIDYSFDTGRPEETVFFIQLLRTLGSISLVQYGHYLVGKNPTDLSPFEKQVLKNIEGLSKRIDGLLERIVHKAFVEQKSSFNTIALAINRLEEDEFVDDTSFFETLKNTTAFWDPTKIRNKLEDIIYSNLALIPMTHTMRTIHVVANAAAPDGVIGSDPLKNHQSNPSVQTFLKIEISDRAKILNEPKAKREEVELAARLLFKEDYIIFISAKKDDFKNLYCQAFTGFLKNKIFFSDQPTPHKTSPLLINYTPLRPDPEEALYVIKDNIQRFITVMERCNIPADLQSRVGQNLVVELNQIIQKSSETWGNKELVFGNVWNAVLKAIVEVPEPSLEKAQSLVAPFIQNYFSTVTDQPFLQLQIFLESGLQNIKAKPLREKIYHSLYDWLVEYGEKRIHHRNKTHQTNRLLLI